jgi:hypothetical protein
VDRLEPLPAGLAGHADQVHRRGRALQGAAQGRLVADVSLDDVDLADVASQPHGVGLGRIAHRHPDPPTGLGQLPHRLGAHEA